MQLNFELNCRWGQVTNRLITTIYAINIASNNLNMSTLGK